MRKIKLEDLGDGWQDRVLELARNGASATEIRSEIDLSYNAFQRMIKDNKEFQEIMEEAKDLSEAWWMNEGRANVRTKTFNSTLWYMNMKNRFGWSDNTKIGGIDGSPIETKENLVFLPVERSAEDEPSGTD